jgi:hypothetical protein
MPRAAPPSAADLPPHVRRRLLVRVLENLRRSIYCLEASNGIVRGNPRYSSPQIFPLAREALFAESVLRAAKAFDHHPKAASYFMLRASRPDIVEAEAADQGFDLARLEAFSGKLRRIRNRALAHDDIDDLAQERDVWGEQDLTAGELSACTRFAFAALNAILNAEFGETVDLLDYDGADAEELARYSNDLSLPDKWAKRLL